MGNAARARRGRPWARVGGDVGSARLTVALLLCLAALAGTAGATTLRLNDPDPGPPFGAEAVVEVGDPAAAPTSPSTTTSTTEPPADEVTMAFTGDILIHSPLMDRAAANGAASGTAFDFRPMFAAVQPLLDEADLAVCHLEVPISPDNAVLASYPAFSSPRELADALPAAGYEACSTASNHSLDQGGTGAAATLDNLDRVGVAHAGMARSAEEAAAPTLLETADGITVAHLSGTYGFNGYVPDVAWRAQTLDPAQLLAEAQRAHDAGADLVVASLHWGIEYQHEPTLEQLGLAATLARSGLIDLIIGHHAHVVQPVRRIGGVPVIFGLGNFISNQSSACCAVGTEDGYLANVRAVRPHGADRFELTVTITPTMVEPGSYVVRPVAASLADPALATLHPALRASWDRTVSVVNAHGQAPPDRLPPPA